MPREFSDEPAVRSKVPLLIGVTGFSGSGKTKSMLRLATGIQRVVGGDIFGIDTESGRMKQYADSYKFRHVPFTPPFGPDDYCDAIDHCVGRGARIVIIDSMSHEHDGEGGLLDQHESYLDRKCGDDWKARQAHSQLAWQKPKNARKRLNARILQLSDVVFLFGYRAQDKIKMVKGEKEPLQLGMQPITTSNLVYDMTLRVLLRPGSDGVPTIKGDTPAENVLVKSIDVFRGWKELNSQLSEDLGEKLARWAAGDSGANKPLSSPPPAVAGPMFRSDIGWDRRVALSGRPLAESSVDDLLLYGMGIQKAMDNPRAQSKPGLVDEFRAHLELVERAIDDKRAEAALGHAANN